MQDQTKITVKLIFTDVALLSCEYVVPTMAAIGRLDSFATFFNVHFFCSSAFTTILQTKRLFLTSKSAFPIEIGHRSFITIKSYCSVCFFAEY